MAKWILPFLILFSFQTFAGIEINGFTNGRFSRAEGRLFNDINETINTFYGGITNNTNANCDGTSASSTCNTCENATTTSCNSAAIHDDLLFEITFTNTGTAGQILVTTDSNDDQEQLAFEGYQENLDLGPNQQVTIGVRWSEFCNELFGLASCNGADISMVSDTSVRIRVGIDENDSNNLDQSSEYVSEIDIVLADIGTSSSASPCLTSDSSDPSGPVACNFIAWPGDSKVFIESVRTGCDFPSVTNSDADIRAIRILYQEDTGAGFPDLSASTADLEVSDPGTCSDGTRTIGLSNNEVAGLSNGTVYQFSIAVVDQANNVGYIVQPTNNSIGDNNSCYNESADDWPQNCHMAAPSEVIGLIQDEFDCFITTATYGSAFQPKVRDFRKFRNRFLKTNLLGQVIVQTYYKTSPFIAKWIRKNPWSKSYFRYVLFPFWLVAKYFLPLSISLLLILFGWVTLPKLRRRLQ